MSHRAALPIALTLAIALSACAGPPSPSQPVPTTTNSPGAVDPGEAQVDEVHGWLVTASNSRITGTARLCAVDTIWTEPDTEFAGIYVEENGGIPDGYGDAMYEIDPHGIRLQFDTGRYFMGYLDGVDGVGTNYEYQGTFTFEKDDDGVPISGSGTGKGKITHPSGDVERVNDDMSFTFSPIPEPDWCTY